MSDRLPLPPSTDESAQSRCETSPERPPAILFRLTNLTCRWKNPYELKSHAMDSGIGSGSDAPVRRMVMPTTFILTPFFSWARAPRLCCACLEWSRAEMRESGVLVVNSRVGIVPSCIRVRCVSSCPLSLFWRAEGKQGVGTPDRLASEPPLRKNRYLVVHLVKIDRFPDKPPQKNLRFTH
jgi:hypothetical protein